MNNIDTIKIGSKDDEGTRLDHFLAKIFPAIQDLKYNIIFVQEKS